MMMILLTMITSNILFIYTSHPLSMGLMLIAQTIMIAFFSSMFMPSFWFSYILILIFLGGLMVLFIYVATLASNEQMNMNFPNLIFIFLAMILVYIFMKANPLKLMAITDNQQETMTFSWMFSSSFISISSFLIIYLFLVLIAIVKITKSWGGSLRPQP